MKLTKYHYRVLMIRFVLNDEIHTLAYFHKDSVTSCKKIQKGCDKKEEIEKDCDKKKGSLQMIINKKRFKNILIKGKDFHRWS